MSYSASPTNRGSLFGWVKSLKRGTLSNDSVNEYSDSDVPSGESKSPTRSVASHAQNQQQQTQAQQMHLSSSSHHFNLGFHHSPQHHQQQAHQSHSNQNIHHSSSPTSPPQNVIPFPHHHQSPSSSDFLRPLLHHKSRSTNNVNRVRSNSNSTNPASSFANSDLRQHRDSFLQSNSLVDENSKYFGVPLADAISQASAKISILGATTSSKSSVDDVLHYGRIPVVVAKCGVYLKKNGLTVEGIFRVGGASKRIKELQIIFNSPPEFGKKLNWEGYTVHDAASVLRRYLNALPEPLIPLHLYDEFRDPLKARPRIIKYMRYKANNPSKVGTSQAAAPSRGSGDVQQPPKIASEVANQMESSSEALQIDEDKEEKIHEAGAVPTSKSSEGSPSAQSKAQRKARNYKKLTRDVYEAIDEYKMLLDDLPQLSKQLLFYILDLLAMVSSNSHQNLMSPRNLAAIFQPSILSHPNHDMDPEEYALSQSVVEFLIQYAYKLLPNHDQPSPEPATPIDTPQPKETKPSEGTLPDRMKSSYSHLDPRTTGRQHSQSLSSPNPDDLDLIGFRNSKVPNRGVALSDTEHDFASGSSEDDCVSETGQGLPRRSDPLNLLYVVNADNTNDDGASGNGGYTSRGSSKLSPPIIVSEAHNG
ncbi:GTPase activating protein (GAP) for Rho1p [Candidozyma auris]|uniref:Rho-GAP domain-containing protein n=2 Tax=Candidozyma auris TaxID=498019 RepID=A0A2H1A2L3_CANAR|nr:hypothetical protein QG37_07880 [[Candida] auris]PIS56802.1 hypothetical protein B9J08_001347 [[Candida] auris]QWW23939.1 hypothetical protein CA7LBN_002773 [[Candida] auris]